MPQPEESSPGNPAATRGTLTVLAAGAISLIVLILLLHRIHQHPDDDYMPDDTVALLAALGHQDDFDARIHQSPQAVVLPAADIKDLIRRPDPAGFAETLKNLRDMDAHPPAFFLLLRPWVTTFGSDYTSAATLNALLLALTVAVLIFIAFQQGNPIGVFMPIALATSTGVARSALEIRPNALAALGLAVAMLGTMPILARRRPIRFRDYFTLSIGSLIAGYAHYLSGPAIAVIFAILLADALRRHERAVFRKIVATAVLTALAFAPLLPTLSAQLRRMRDDRLTTPTRQSEESHSLRWTDAAECLALNATTFPKSMGRTAPVTAGAILLAAAVGLLLLTQRYTFAAYLAAATCLFVLVPALFVRTDALSPHVLQPKYFIGFAVVLTPLLSHAYTAHPSRLAKVVLAVLFLPLLSTNLYFLQHLSRPSYAAIFTQNAIHDLADADVVLIDSPRRLVVLPLAAKVKESATLVIGTNLQLQDWLKKGQFPPSVGRKGFYCSPNGTSHPFALPENP